MHIPFAVFYFFNLIFFMRKSFKIFSLTFLFLFALSNYASTAIASNGPCEYKGHELFLDPRVDAII
jgi:hypothetical protein